MQTSTNAEQLGFRIRVEKTDDGYKASGHGLEVVNADSAAAVRSLSKMLSEAQMTGALQKTRRMA